MVGFKLLTRHSEECKNTGTQAFLPDHKDHVKAAPPQRGCRNVKVPMTKVVLCVSKKDIICTASLTSQLACLAVTVILIVSMFSNGRGQVITINQYIRNIYSFEVAMILNTIIDPVVCIIFSSNFRKAARSICNKVSTRIHSICKPSNTSERKASNIELGVLPKQD